MPNYSEASKQYTYTWRAANKESYNTYMNEYMKTHYDPEKRKRAYLWKTAKTEFLAILL